MTQPIIMTGNDLATAPLDEFLIRLLVATGVGTAPPRDRDEDDEVGIDRGAPGEDEEDDVGEDDLDDEDDDDEDGDDEDDDDDDDDDDDGDEDDEEEKEE